ncbi:hypothetical protein LOD99_10813 [Oopsacas minuta]|uniref:Fibronectin type-III domain-containing protein n=1 Tax=Oopsacas minuta TaxID=111878 RepID=A0AAV7KEB6_9METZ|nr:hypothetical protein LOD99_10813 [Oopsacas minuta]
MICSVVSPTSDNFIDSTALISFNGSTSAITTTIDDNTLAGVDTTRYTSDTAGLTISTDIPGVRLTISDYQATDGDIVIDSPQGLTVPPSSPPVTLSEPNNNCTNIVINWATPDSDRDIIEYSVYRNNTLLTTTTTDNNYTDTNQLTVNTVYEYYVTAISCAGNSTPGVNTVSLGGYSTNNSPQLFLRYDNTTSILTIDWTLLPVMTPPLLMLEYSLDLIYNHTQSDITHQFSNSTTFLLLSSITEYNTYITPHNFTTDDGVVTNITACIQIIQQCGVFNGQTIC